MKVGYTGDTVSIEAVLAQLNPAGVSTATYDTPPADGFDVLVCAGMAGANLFDRVAAKAQADATRLVTIELAGIGGEPFDDVEATISQFTPDSACYQCLKHRIETSSSTGGSRSGSVDETTRRIAGSIAGGAVLEPDHAGAFATIHELPHTDRQLLPVPGCEGCDPDWHSVPSAAELDISDNRSFENTLSAAEQALDDRLGPVRSVAEVASIPLPYYYAELAGTPPTSDGSVPEAAAGVGFDWNKALMRALGEGLERYAAATYAESTFMAAEPGDLSSETVVKPSEFVGPPPEGRAEGSHRWVRGWELDDGLGPTRLLPSEVVVFPPGETTIRPAITTGLALGSSVAEAIEAGILEVLERDAAMLAWYSDYNPLGLGFRSGSDLAELARRIRARDLELDLCLLTQDLDIPIVAASVSRSTEWPKLAVGSAAGFSARSAAVDAAREAVQNWMELAQMDPELAGTEAERIANYADQPEPVATFFETDHEVALEDVGFEDIPDQRERIQRLDELLTGASLPTYIVPLTTRDLAALDFAVVRAVIPAAQPLFLGEPYFGLRAQKVPATLGFEHRPSRPPHPFP